MNEGAADRGVDSAADRSHFRVSTRIPLIYEVVEPSARHALVDEILGALEPPEIDLEAGQIAWLDRIERKLDLVLHALQMGGRPILGSDDIRGVLLSGSGLSFDAPEEIPTGTHLLLSFELPGTPIRLVRCIGEVVGGSPGSDSESPTVAVAFDTIRPSDIDAVVAYTVSVQRQQIRASRGKGGSER